MLSRLQSAKQANTVKDGLKKGEVDILIGTHAVLSESVNFHDLGLVIIDEEQRFGVKHKERLKQLRESVDVLTLTATPIPRTLQMSLTGIKTLSTITTPPVDRLAVRSYVMPYDPKVVREAIMREIFRNGQVYMVTPRIQELGRLAEQIGNLVPEASIVTAHGQMGAEALDEVMHRFYHGEVHVLLATSIIESGLDVPRANTIIVFEADRFGLAQLYQLKGRVGRSKVRAYAYFMLPFSRGLSDDAEKRLKVLQRLEGLGAGFTLASYDMDIRGPGNLLGKEQSGHIQDVGFELYNQMLGEAIASYKASGGQGGMAEGSFTPVLNLGMTFLIPNEYVKETNVRLGLYRRLANISTDVEVADFKAELLDRFGPVPPEVEALLEVITLKNRCKALNIEKIEVGEKGTVLGFYKNTFAKPDALLHYILQNSGLISLRQDQSLVFHRKWADQEARLKGIVWLLDQLEKL
jgi:transcription-repair coupling factor (superfamily II helicase)